MAVLSGTALASPVPVDAVVFDMDGVLTDTARVHRVAWKRLFDDYLQDRAERLGEEFVAFTEDDYLAYVDGKRREDGVASFLASRGVDPDPELVADLAARKNRYFLSALDRDGVASFPDTVEFVRSLQDAGVATALITASRNAQPVLEGAGLENLFEVRVDGVVAAELGLPGKPDPAVFVEAMQRLGAATGRTAIVEDAVSGVQAGRAGGFALVVGVDRTTGDEHGESLRRQGADIVVSALDQLEVKVDDAR
jgi:beta-phosphoglucomutase family hydrolase